MSLLVTESPHLHARSRLLLLLLAAALAHGCSSASGPSDVAAGPGELVDPGRGVLLDYLAATDPLDHSNTQVAYDVARRGEALLPELVVMLGEDRPPLHCEPVAERFE